MNTCSNYHQLITIHAFKFSFFPIFNKFIITAIDIKRKQIQIVYPCQQ